MRSFILLIAALLAGYTAYGSADERYDEESVTDFNFETGGIHPYSRFTIDLFHDNVTESPGNIDMTNWRNRGIQISLVWPFRSRGPGISPAAGISLGNNNYYNNGVYEWAFNEDGDVPAANIIPDDTSGSFRNKLSVSYLEVPLELQYISSEVRSEQFIITLGVRSGLLIDSKTKYSSEDHTLKLKTGNHFRPFRVMGYARMGYKRYRLFAQYGMFGIFDHDDAPQMQQYSLGLSVMLW